MYLSIFGPLIVLKKMESLDTFMYFSKSHPFTRLHTGERVKELSLVIFTERRYVKQMETLISIVKSTWYIGVIIILLSIFKLFLPRIKGFLGEKSAAIFLSRLDSSKYKVINNIMLQIGGKTSQIDHVVISNFGIFVIETKNYKGRIIGNEYDDYWTQVIFKSKEKLRNPIKQSFGHIQALKEHLKEFPDIKYISIVAFTTKADLKLTTQTDVVYTVELIKTIKAHSTFEIISDTDKEKIYSKLLSLNVDSKEARKAHIKSIKDNLSETGGKIQNNICPKCGGALVLRSGKYGQFKGCSNYPKCRFILK
jgi:hypothetical protein